MMSGMETSTAIVRKANRLVEQGRVSHVKGLVYEVEGDTAKYIVHLSFPQEASGRCNCKSALAVCSHILAASIAYLADPPLHLVPTADPFANIQGA
jgi:hypothetical protein